MADEKDPPAEPGKANGRPHQYRFPFDLDKAPRFRLRVKTEADPVYYDASQLEFAAFVERESDHFDLDGGEFEAHVRAHATSDGKLLWIGKECHQGIVASEPRAAEPDDDRYRPSILIDALIPFDLAQDMHANLADLYPRWVERHGSGKAIWVVRLQVGMLIGGTLWEKTASFAERLLKIVRLIGS